MATFLKPDSIVTTDNGLTIKQKIIPDNLLATKDVASHVRKGQKMKPCAKLSGGTGKPKGITVHNTEDIKVASGTNAAEQYTRATYNGNMNGVVVHFYVWDNEIWQNLREDERGWHAADGSTRRSSQRGDGSKIGGNLDTIAIECIGDRKQSEDTTAKLVAWLCRKHGLDPKTDVYTHKYFYSKKYCPQYILPHWDTFLATVQKYYDALAGKASEPKDTKPSQTAPKKWTPKVGDVVMYTGSVHYASANTVVAKHCKGGKAKITSIYQLGKSKHPYHLVAVAGGGSTVYGWVNAGTFTKA